MPPLSTRIPAPVARVLRRARVVEAEATGDRRREALRVTRALIGSRQIGRLPRGGARRVPRDQGDVGADPRRQRRVDRHRDHRGDRRAAAGTIARWRADALLPAPGIDAIGDERCLASDLLRALARDT
jgi:hypothetical protein